MSPTEALALLQEYLLYLVDCEVSLDDPPGVIVQIELEPRGLVRPLGDRLPGPVLLLDPHVVPALHDGDRGDHTKDRSYNYMVGSQDISP